MTFFKLLAHKGIKAGGGEIKTFTSQEAAEVHKRVLLSQQYSEADIRIFPIEVRDAVAV